MGGFRGAPSGAGRRCRGGATSRPDSWHGICRRGARPGASRSPPPLAIIEVGRSPVSGTVSRNRCRLAVTAAHIDQAEAPTFRADRDGAAELGRELQV